MSQALRADKESLQGNGASPKCLLPPPEAGSGHEDFCLDRLRVVRRSLPGPGSPSFSLSRAPVGPFRMWGC